MIDSVIKRKTARSLRARYLIGLTVIALLVTASFMTMQRVVSEQRNFARLVNLAGHQSGLVNRVAYFASEMAATDDPDEFEKARAQVGRTINRIQDAHRLLREGSLEAGIPRVSSATLAAIYDDPMVGLDLAMERFLVRAHTVYSAEMDELGPSSAAFVFLNVYGPHVLEPLLDAAVDEYETIGREAILRIERLEQAIWGATLLTLLLELLVIFRPLETRVRQAIESLEDTVAELQETRTRLVAAQALALVGDWQWKARTGMLACSEQTYRILGVDPDDFDPSLEAMETLLQPEDRAIWRLNIQRAAVQTESGPLAFSCRIMRPDGGQRVVHQQIMARRDADGRAIGLVGTVQDITERHELATRLQKLSQHVPGFIYQYEMRKNGTSRFPYASQGITELYGVWPEQVQEDAAVVSQRIHPKDVQRISSSIFLSARELSVWSDQYRVQHPTRGEIWVEGHATPERLGDGGTLWYGYIWEITERKRAEDQIRELALYDPLTGLANRRLLRDRLERALAAAQRSAKLGAVLMLDLDNFKTLNDTQGHDIGDALLREVARRMSETVRACDTVARLGGDEFVIVLEGLSRQETEARIQALRIAESVHRSVSQPYHLGEKEQLYQTSVSIGVAFFEDASGGVDDLLRRADIGMFEAKEAGRNRVCLFSEQRQRAINSRTSLLQELRQALQERELMLYYQPQFRPSGELCAAEALLRWQSPARGFVRPGDFIPLAEETGLIVPIGEWVLDMACRHLRALQDFALPEGFSISVNISPRQFSDPRFLDKVRDALTTHGAPVQRLKLELTESSLFQNMEHATRVLGELRAIGLGIELDDFGTGYSSLSCLKTLPLDALKLDGSLVCDITGDARDSAIVRAVIAMAKTLSLQVIAEGVETQEQRAFLAHEGCDRLQGFLMARPMPFKRFCALLEPASQCRHIDGAVDQPHRFAVLSGLERPDGLLDPVANG